MDETQKDWIRGLAVAAVACMVYANSLGNGFVADDPVVILHNPVLQGSPLSLFNTIDSISDTQILPFYRPLTYQTFAVEGRLHGFDPFLMHLINVLLHAVNAFLVYLLARSLFKDYRPALIASLLFVVHPIHAESVNYLSGGRNTMLASLFVLMAYLAHQRSIARDNLSHAFAGALLFLAGLFSKEFALMVLPFIVAQEWSSLRGKGSHAWSRSVMRLAPYAVALAGYLLLRWWTLSGLGLQTGLIPGLGARKLHELYIIPGFAERILNNIYIIPQYLLTIVWPTALSPRYAVPGELLAIAPQLVAGWACVIACIAWLLKRGGSRPAFFGLFWLAAFWIPVSGIFYFSIIEMADRYVYLPAIGLWILTADQLSGLFRSEKKIVRRYAVVFIAIVIITAAALTAWRNLDWKSDLTLFSRMVEQYPENAHGYFNLGRAYLARNGPNDLKTAEQNLEQVLVLDPSAPTVQALLGYLRLQRRDFDGALQYLSEELRYYPLDREARINRGITYEQMGRYEEALSDYEFYLTIPGQNDLQGSREYAEAKVHELAR